MKYRIIFNHKKYNQLLCYSMVLTFEHSATLCRPLFKQKPVVWILRSKTKDEKSIGAEVYLHVSFESTLISKLYVNPRVD